MDSRDRLTEMARQANGTQDRVTPLSAELGALRGPAAERSRKRTIRGLATLTALISLVALSPPTALSDDGRSPAATAVERHGPYVERSLSLTVPLKINVGRPAAIRVEGVALAGDEVSAFVKPRGGACPLSSLGAPERAVGLLDDVPVDGSFLLEEGYTPTRPGDHSFCAYLGPEPDRAEVRVGHVRTAIARRLREAVARRTAIRALKRHGFAKRVVKAAESDCRRRSRDTFACELSARFPGYRLKGKGRVRLRANLSYRFRVKAQGVRFTLTDENEE